MMYMEPWPHSVEDDLYDEIKMTRAVHEILGVIQTDRDQFVLKSANRCFITAVNVYGNPKFPLVNELLATRDIRGMLNLFPDHREWMTLHKYAECILCLGGAEHPIHDEAFDKVLSSVTYMYPLFNQGTILYNHDKTFAKQVPWKANRTLVFAGKSGETWHSYRASGDLRITLNEFLMR